MYVPTNFTGLEKNNSKQFSLWNCNLIIIYMGWWYTGEALFFSWICIFTLNFFKKRCNERSKIEVVSQESTSLFNSIENKKIPSFYNLWCIKIIFTLYGAGCTRHVRTCSNGQSLSHHRFRRDQGTKMTPCVAQSNWWSWAERRLP